MFDPADYEQHSELIQYCAGQLMYQDQVGDWEEAGVASYQPDDRLLEDYFPAEY